MVLKNWTQKKGVCASALDSFLKMVDLERCSVLFLCGFSAYFLRKNSWAKAIMWRGLWFLQKKIFPRATPKASFFDTPLPCHFSAEIWKLKIWDFVRQTCNYLALSELRDNLWSCIGMIWTGKNCAANKHATSGYLTAYTYFLTRKCNLLRYA